MYTRITHHVIIIIVMKAPTLKILSPEEMAMAMVEQRRKQAE